MNISRNSSSLPSSAKSFHGKRRCGYRRCVVSAAQLDAAAPGSTCHAYRWGVFTCISRIRGRPGIYRMWRGGKVMTSTRLAGIGVAWLIDAKPVSVDHARRLIREGKAV